MCEEKEKGQIKYGVASEDLSQDAKERDKQPKDQESSKIQKESEDLSSQFEA